VTDKQSDKAGYQTTAQIIYERLKQPFPVDAIHWRPGATNREKTKCIALAYINARDAMKRLDDVVGWDKWQCTYTDVRSGIICNIGIQIANEWIWKADGAGETDIEGEKGASSDAFKRAAVRFGVGRYLYYLPNVWVDMDERRRIVAPPQLPRWATP